MTTKQEILIKNGYLQLPQINGALKVRSTFTQSVATVLANMAHYGYAPNVKLLEHLTQLSTDDLISAWERSIKPALEVVTGANKKMESFVVYKNFPSEVLDMSQAQYWFSQICMYVGFPNEFFTQDVKERAPLREDLKLKVLQLAGGDVFHEIFAQLVANKARWTDDQRDHAKFLGVDFNIVELPLANFGFKENGIELIAHLGARVQGFTATIPDATDVLRLASVLSGGDPGLREKVKFKSFSRAQRKFLVNLLENAKNLDDDVAARAETWKKLLMRLHPGDFKAPRVQNAYNVLYNDDYETFNSKIEAVLAPFQIPKAVPNSKPKLMPMGTRFSSPLADKLRGVKGKPTEAVPTDMDAAIDEAIELLSQRPGVFARRFHEVARVFRYDERVIDAFLSVTDKLSNSQLLKLDGYLRTINTRKMLAFAPKGNWAKMQYVENGRKPIPTDVVVKVRSYIQGIVAQRMNAAFPNGVKLDFQTMGIKLQSNDQELAPYGRGTVFEIPDNVTFLRSASYWGMNETTKQAARNVWFDNGWNFFDDKWESLGACCWYNESFPEGYSYYRSSRAVPEGTGAIFSGDPTNSKDLGGRACQMIDLYLDKLEAAGVRYAVWNILAFSRIEFSEWDVLGTLQWGENAEEGNLYEPSRAQMVFPLKGKSLTKFIAYVDVKERKLVYMDVGFGVSTSSATHNGIKLAQLLPPYMEYLDTLPTVADLFIGVESGETPILYSDASDKIEGGKAYVFRPENSANHFEQIDIIKLLG